MKVTYRQQVKAKKIEVDQTVDPRLTELQHEDHGYNLQSRKNPVTSHADTHPNWRSCSPSPPKSSHEPSFKPSFDSLKRRSQCIKEKRTLLEAKKAKLFNQYLDTWKQEIQELQDYSTLNAQESGGKI